MTSTVIVRDEIHRFLESEEPEVLCLTGAWGVGKTFTWKKFLLDSKNRPDGIGLSKYAYVSLFGQNSLDDVRSAIVEETRPTSTIGEPIDFSSLDGAKKTARAHWRLAFNQLRGLATEYLPETVSGRWLFLSVRKQIICIDDLERCGKELERKDVLGLISFLKEERACKIVLLLNEEKLGQHRDEFQAFLEKVVDTRLVFKPTPLEAVGVGLTSKDNVRELLSDNFIKLGVTNIRVVRKVEYLALRLLEMLGTQDTDVARQALHSVALFGWMYYQPQEAPPLSYLTTYSPGSFLDEGGPLDDLFEKQPENEGKEKAWKSLLSSYGLTSVDELDKVILDGIEAGAFDPSAVRREVQVLLQRLEHQRVDSSFSDAWRLYRSSFGVSADEVASKMSEAFKKAVHTISPTNLNATISLFKGIGRDQEARDLLDFYMASRADQGAGLFDLDRHPFGGDVKDADVRRAFKAAALAKVDTTFDAGKTLLQMAEGGWSDEDIVRLSKMTAEDYCKLFKTHAGDDLLVTINQALKFGQIVNATQPMKEIAQKAAEALKMIAAESSINRYKIQHYFGVVLDDGK